jgi:hypothetical protein
MTIMKQHILNVNLNEVEKMSQDFSKDIKGLMVFFKQVENFPEKFPTISKLIGGLPKTSLISSLTDSLALHEKSHEKIHSDFQGWKAEAMVLLQFAENATFVNIKQLEAHLRNNPPSAGAIAILVIEAVERERKRALEEKKNRFASVQKKGTQKKKEVGQQLRDAILRINADLLKKPASEGWGVKKKRAIYISERTRKAISYINKIIAVPRKTNQT